MLTDLRNLPDGVRERLRRNFGDDVLTQRHRGFDLERRGEIVEQRFAPTPMVEVRADNDGGAPIIAGYATVYERSYDVFGGPDKGGWSEIIGNGAARKSANEAGGRDEEYDVKLFFDHEGLPLASVRAGTLSLRSDATGLWTEATPDIRSPYSMEIVSRIQRRELDAMSFAFTVLRQRWEDLDGNEDDPMTAPVRRIQEVKLFDASVVSFPANPAASVGLKQDRSASGMSLDEARALRDAPVDRGMSLADAKAALA